jgi:glycosyltransferase involved in cell wall biosynthesis
MPNPVVSIIMIAYKHEQFIAQAIEGVMMQQTTFPYKLFIGDDRSPDRTEAIALAYEKQFPDRIKVLPRTKNMGVMPNLIDCYEQTVGSTYMCICEGDDYWTDPLKLQRQFDFMEANPSFSACFHNAKVEFFQGGFEDYNLNDNIEKDVFTLDDFVGEDEVWFMATASVFHRRSMIGNMPEWLKQSRSGDIPIYILETRNGPIKYLPQTMAVYRKHAGGVSLTDYKDDEPFLRNRIFMYSKLNEETGFKFNDRFEKNIGRYYRMLLDSKQYKGLYFKSLPIAFKYLKLAKPTAEIRKDIYRNYITPPWFLGLTRKIKSALGMIPKG